MIGAMLRHFSNCFNPDGLGLNIRGSNITIASPIPLNPGTANNSNAIKASTPEFRGFNGVHDHGLNLMSMQSRRTMAQGEKFLLGLGTVLNDWSHWSCSDRSQSSNPK